MERAANRCGRVVCRVALTLSIAVFASPSVAQVITEIPVPSTGQPMNLASGPGGVWFTEQGVNRIGMLTAEGNFSEFDINRPAFELVADPDGNVWFTSDRFLSRITPDGIVTDFAISGLARGISAGPDGNIWFTEMPPGLDGVGDGVGRATLNGEITEFTDQHRASCWGDITAGVDGNLWCTDWSEIADDSVVRVTPSGMATRFRIPPNANVGPTAIAPGSDGALWFCEQILPQIGRMTPSGEYSTVAVAANGITAGPDGNLWLAQADGVGLLTVRGEYEGLSLPTRGSGAQSIAAGSDGLIWFTEINAFVIGRIEVGPSPRTLVLSSPPHRDTRMLPTR